MMTSSMLDDLITLAALLNKSVFRILSIAWLKLLQESFGFFVGNIKQFCKLARYRIVPACLPQSRKTLKYNPAIVLVVML